MAWNTKFYHEFRDTNDILCRVDIMEDAAASNVELEGEASPFNIIFPEIKDKLDPVRGSGCELNLISATDRQLASLFTAEIQQYRIKYTVAGTTTWFGYLDSEQHSETYSELTDYPVQFTGNNGFGVLNRIKFLDSGVQYTGLKTQWEILEIILTEWGLLDLVTNIKIYLSTDSTQLTIGATETIMEHTYVSCANYYDEDGEPMTCREVLEAILAPYGAYITVVGTEILITDLDTLGTDSGFTWLVYTNALVYSTTAASDAIGDIETIGYYETGASLDTQAGRNRQVIRYSRYALDSLNTHIQDPDTFSYQSGTEPNFIQISDGYGSTSYLAENMDGLDDWTFEDITFPWYKYTVAGAKESVGDEPEYFIRIYNQNYGVGTVDHGLWADDYCSRTWDVPYLIGDNKFYLKITGKMRARTRPDPYIEGTFTDTVYFDRYYIAVRVKIGSKSFTPNGATPWTTGDYYVYFLCGEAFEGNVKNKWLPLRADINASEADTAPFPRTDEGILIGLDDTVHGTLKLEFTPYILADADEEIPLNDDRIKAIFDLWIKDLKVELVKKSDKTPAGSDDLEYLGELDSAWKDEGSDITLNHGNSFVGSPFDNAGLMYDSGSGVYKFLSNWSRGGETDVTIEKLLLNTVESNYEGKTTKLSVNLNNSSHIPFQRIEDTTYLSGQILMFAGGTLDCAHNSLECTLIEIRPDNLTIA